MPEIERMSMEDEELDALLQVLENPVRRKIIKRLSQGPSYALQMSKELGLGQPLIAKHLTMMEEAGLVSSYSEPSANGPKRKTYALAKSVSITLDLAPNLFMQKGLSFNSISPAGLREEETKIMIETSKLSGESIRDFPAISELLERVDAKLEDLEMERAYLLYIRNKALESAMKAIGKLEGREKRRVAHSILEQHDMDVRRISEDLDLREAEVRDILREMRDLFD
jgi:predicted transcriptional regulator